MGKTTQVLPGQGILVLHGRPASGGGAGDFEMTVTAYGRTGTGATVHRVALASEVLRMQVLTFGAAIERLEAPDAGGAMANVVLGLPTLDGYLHDSPHFGAVPGRFANRIAGGEFVLDGTEFTLTRNEGPNTRHGGAVGFGKRIWTIEDSGARHVVLRLVSLDGEEGFPGRLDAHVTYTLDGADVRIDYRAVTDAPTVLNLTNHSYFNLGGEGSGTALDHVLTMEADAFLPVTAASIPTGDIRPVAGTAFDFRVATPIGARIRDADEQLRHGQGYDHNFVLRPEDGLRQAARLVDPGSGRVLDVLTTEPGVQFYTSNKLTGALVGPGGRCYRSGDAVCLETQHFPDSPNRPAFPSTVLRPGETFLSTTVFRFGVVGRS